jgi:hypothetical protein
VSARAPDGARSYLPLVRDVVRSIRRWGEERDWRGNDPDDAAEHDGEALERAERLAVLVIRRLLNPAGFAHFQQRPRWMNRIPFIRWTTAPTYRALSGLLAQLNGEAVAYGHEHVAQPL